MAFKSVLDPNFRYRSAASTDVRKTFERVRRELAERRRLAEHLDERESAPVIAVIGNPRAGQETGLRS